MKIEVTKSQLWLLAKAITEFTSEEGLDKFLTEFPDCDQDLLAQDLEGLVAELAKHGKSYDNDQP